MPRLTDQERYLRTISEASWQRTVIEAGHRLGWLCFYVPDALYRRSFIRGIPLDLGDKGFPDICAVHPSSGRLIFRELKTMTGTLNPEQIKWRDALLLGGHDWKLWRPDQGDEMEQDFTEA
jgi:hypothetical protein